MAEEIVVALPSSGLEPAIGDLEQLVDVALTCEPDILVLDMRAVERLSSTTVALVLWTRRRCATHGVEVILRQTSRRCREVIERTALLDAVRVEPPDYPAR